MDHVLSYMDSSTRRFDKVAIDKFVTLQPVAAGDGLLVYSLMLIPTKNIPLRPRARIWLCIMMNHVLIDTE